MSALNCLEFHFLILIICIYHNRSFYLIDRDLKVVLPDEEVHESILNSIRHDLTKAFQLREELINMKKVAYHVHHSGALIERSLAQLATYFRTDHADCDPDASSSNSTVEPEASIGESATVNSNPTAFYFHTDRFTTIVDARMRCKGACHAAADARAIAKQICCLPRHPLKKRPAIMANLPDSLETASLIRNTLLTLNSDDSFEDPVKLGGLPTESIHCTTWKAKVEAALTGLNTTHGDIDDDVVEFVRLIVICRGADKAIRMVDEVFTAQAAIQHICGQMESLLPLLAYRENILEANVDKAKAELERIDSESHNEQRKHSLEKDISNLICKKIHYHRHANLLSGALPHLIELVAWLKKIGTIVETAGEHKVLFLGGDSSADRHTLPAALQAPKVEIDTMALFMAYRAVEAQYRPQMFNAIRTRGWPSSLQHALAISDIKEDKVADNKHCHVCERTYSCLWVHRGVCCECEDRIRQMENRCPYRVVCKSSWFCAHSRRCLICDSHSCGDCRLVRGDASTVTAVAGDIQPCRIAFDFDRTLASTKSGAPPVVGKHTADVDLISLMWKYPCAVVTRNQNKDAIRLFLEEQGAPTGLDICIVGKKESKVGHILGMKDGTTGSDGLQSDDDNRTGPILFVDDSVQELADPLVAQEASIYRILFVRSLA